MNCPICGGKSKVVDTGIYSDMIVRKRKCLECNDCFFTMEVDFDDKAKARYLLNKSRMEHRNADDKRL